MEKQCRICGNIFTTIKQGTSRQFCFTCVPQTDDINIRTISKRRAIKAEGVRLLGGQCLKCGENRPYLLDFHHIEKETKDYSPSSLIMDSKIEEFFEEIQKCILFCSNCHREFHWLEQDSSFKLTDYVELINYSFPKTNREYSLIEKNLCIDCHKEIDSKAVRCVECSNLFKQTTPRPSREELKVLIRTLPFTEIGKKYGVTDNSIRKGCLRVNLPILKRQIKKYTNDEWNNI